MESPLFTGTLGLLLGGLITALFFRRAAKLKDEALGTLQQHHAALLAEKQLFEAERETEKAGREKESLERLQLTELRGRHESEIRALNERLAREAEERTKLEQQFKEAFENLANRILEDKTARFTETNKKEMEGLIRPMGEKLTQFETLIQKYYTDESKERHSLKGEVNRLLEMNQTLNKQAENLSLALKGESKTQGNWGETILMLLLEKSGLREGLEFQVQPSFSEEGGRKQPDIIVNLPGERHIIVDAKVSFTAYERYTNASSEEEKAVALKAHLISMENHVRELSKKEYHKIHGITSPDFILLFLPIEAAYSLAVEAKPELFATAFEQNVVLVTPATLFSTLRLASLLWQQDRQSQNALKIAEEGGALHDLFMTLLEEMTEVHKGLRNTDDAFQQIFKRISGQRGSLLKRVEHLKVLGAKASKTLPQKFKTIAEHHEEADDEPS